MVLWANGFLHGLQASVPCAEAAGFKTVLIEPVITAYFKYVSYEYQSVYGKVAVRWEISDGKVCLDICIPVNTKARLRLHTTEKIVSDGLKFAYSDDGAEADAGSGKLSHRISGRHGIK